MLFMSTKWTISVHIEVDAKDRISVQNVDANTFSVDFWTFSVQKLSTLKGCFFVVVGQHPQARVVEGAWPC